MIRDSILPNGTDRRSKHGGVGGKVKLQFRCFYRGTR